MTGSSLYQKNLVALESALPGIARMARESAGTITTAVGEADGPATDIDLGGGRLYNRPAPDFAREQVASWLQRPDRVLVNRPTPESLKDICTRSLVERLSDVTGDSLSAVPPKSQSGLLVVVGLGLGHHVRELLEHLTPRHVVVIEPIEEFVLHSLRALDWAELVTTCRERGTSIDVIANFDPRAVQTELEALIGRFGAACMDGAYSFMHYQTDATRDIARGFRELAGMKSILQGYYEDEKLMIENTIANVSGDEFWLIDGTFCAPHDLPAIIVGSGPSLDDSLEALRRVQNRAVIFCAGSALQSLLAAGIRPDFQVEKENNEVTEARIMHIFERADVDGDRFDVSLIGSATVKPGVVGLFRDALLFHRDMLSSTRMFGAEFNPVIGTGPFSANTAVAAATVLGFRRMYFFGCDCGSVDQDQHHARETVY
ncbi:MAG: motility associated factor glycosyltransferase family protein, partial [Alphaproteobacteria bacterium]|nr:motility associated factor glycosyltransferase family protein [Alphaproteobacteria bacterium]